MKCKNCGAEIDESLETCPECNAPLSFIPIIPEEENLKDVINPKIIRAIIVIILVLAIFGLIAALILFQLDIIGPESALWAGGKKSSPFSRLFSKFLFLLFTRISLYVKIDAL